MRLKGYAVVCFLFPVIGVFIFMAKMNGKENDARNALQWTLYGAFFNVLVVFFFLIKEGSL